MKEYAVKYISHDGDLHSVWVVADSKEDAKMQVRAEYRDIKEIIQVRKM